MRVFLDSDVIIAALDGREAQSRDAQRVMDLLEDGVLQAITTPVVLANVMYVVGQKWRLSRTRPDRARIVDAMESILGLVNVIPIEEAHFHAAFSSRFDDLEDGIQHFAALDAGRVDAIVTCNVKDFVHSRLPVLEPAEVIARAGAR